MKGQVLFNPDNSCADICRTIKHSYNGCRANLIRTSTFGQTGVLEIETMQELIQCKQLRKQNGDKGMKFNDGNRQYSPRTDGISNTLSTITKDNMLAVPELRMEDGCLVDKEGRRYRIRKLTPTECFRLQDVSDEDIEKIRSYRDSETEIICDANGEPIMNMDFGKPPKNARKITIMVNGEQREYYCGQLIWKNKDKGISKTAQYKLAGNSICVAPMYHIFRKLFIENGCENQQLELF